MGSRGIFKKLENAGKVIYTKFNEWLNSGVIDGLVTGLVTTIAWGTDKLLDIFSEGGFTRLWDDIKDAFLFIGEKIGAAITYGAIQGLGLQTSTKTGEVQLIESLAKFLTPDSFYNWIGLQGQKIGIGTDVNYGQSLK